MHLTATIGCILATVTGGLSTLELFSISPLAAVYYHSTASRNSSPAAGSLKSGGCLPVCGRLFNQANRRTIDTNRCAVPNGPP